MSIYDPVSSKVKVQCPYTTPYRFYWAVDTPGGGVQMFHYSGRNWNRGSGEWRVFWNDQAEVARFTDPEAFLKEYHPDMPVTPDSIRKLGDKWSNRRNKTSCGEDEKVLQEFTSAFNNQDNLRYNAFGLFTRLPNCSSFGEDILNRVLGPLRAQTGIGPKYFK